MTHPRCPRIRRRRFLALSASAAALAAAPAVAQTRAGGTFISAKTTEAPSLDPILEQALSRQRLDPRFYNRVVEPARHGVAQRVGGRGLVMWDNQCALHRGRPWDESAHRRVMHRTTVAGEGPTAADVPDPSVTPARAIDVAWGRAQLATA